MRNFIFVFLEKNTKSGQNSRAAIKQQKYTKWHIFAGAGAKRYANLYLAGSGANMANFLWAKTILSAYRYVPKIIKEVDNIVAEHALRSSGFDCSSFSQLSTLSQIDRMVKLTDLKNRAAFLKSYVEETMSKLSFIKQKLLSEIFFENKKITKVVMIGQLSPRTYYRRIQEALIDFEKIMDSSSYTSLDFEKDFRNDDWILRIQATFLNKNAA